MFDTVRGKGNVPAGRFGEGTVVSIVVYGALVALAIWLPSHESANKKDETEVTFFAAPPPPPPPPPPKSSGSQKPKTEKKVRKKKKPDTIVQPKEVPKEIVKEEPEPEPEVEPEPEGEPQEEVVEGGQEGGQEGGVVGGTEGGVVGGQIGGQLGGTLGGQLGGEVLPFGSGMTMAERLSGRDPVYTEEARRARAEGLMIVKCTITVEGRLEDCKIIKPIPHMEKAVLDALRTWRMSPVRYQGRPVTVTGYTIRVKLRLED